MNIRTRQVTLGNKTLSFETGKLAKQAGGSVIVRSGDSVVLVTACRAANQREGNQPGLTWHTSARNPMFVKDSVFLDLGRF